MAEDGSIPGETPPLELRLVQVLLRTSQSVMAVRRAGVEAQVLTGVEAALQAAFGPVWERMRSLELDIDRDAVRFGGAVALAREEDTEGLIDALGSAGIRKLVLQPGAETEEIVLLLAAVVAERSGAQTNASDLPTALFRADLHHIEYVLEDAGPAEMDAPAPRPHPIESSRARPRRSPEAVREAVRSDVSTTSGSGFVRLEQFDSTLYFLDDREIAYLKTAIDREYSQDLAVNALGLLLDILETRPEPSVRDEVIGILEDFLPELLAEGRFEAVAALVSGVREAARVAVELTEAQKSALDRLRSSISASRALSQLFHALEGGAVAPTAGSMDMLLRELRPTAIGQVLTWGKRLSDPATRDAVGDAVDAFFTEWPHGLSRMLGAGEEDVVRSGLELAARLKHAAFVDIVAEVASHQDPRIRRQAAETLAAYSTAPAMRRLLDMVDDSDGQVRIVVYRTFATRPSRGAFGPLARAIEHSDLDSMGQQEKRALFEAFAAAAGPDGITVLEPLLRGGSPFGRRPSSHTRACAAVGLGIIGTPAAHLALRGTAKDKDPLVRNAVSAALRGEA